MNNSQRGVLYIAGVLFVLMLLFPPFHYRATGVNAGYGLLFSPPHAWASLNVVQLVLSVGGSHSSFLNCMDICWKKTQKQAVERDGTSDNDLRFMMRRAT